MCNYKYKFKKHQLSEALCLYPAFYAGYGARFPDTKVLPIDKEGYCIFHSRDKNWKKQNDFAGKFHELLNVSIALAKDPNPPKWNFNFAGFYFCDDKDPLLIRDRDIPYSLDFSFCEFVNGVTIQDANIKSIELVSATLRDIFTLTNTRFWDNFFSTRVSFDKGLLATNCFFDSYSYFDQCTFRNVGNNSVNTFKFRGCTTDYLSFEASTFESGVLFEKTVFNNEVIFDRSSFSDEFHIHGCEVNGSISFRETTFLLPENTNPMYSTVDLRNLILSKTGRILFSGKEPFESMVRGELDINFAKPPEGLISFENFNLNKIASFAKVKLLELEKTSQVQIEKGCRKYYCQTEIFEINATRADQQLILDMVKVFCNYFDLRHGFNLGMEIVERKPDLIRYFFFTDEIISDAEFLDRMKVKEKELWQTFSKLSEYAGEQLTPQLIEERNSLIDMAAIFLKIRSRIQAVDFYEDQLEQITSSISVDGISVVNNAVHYKEISNGFQSFYKNLPSIRLNLPDRKDFISDFIEGIQRLQSNDSNEICIRNIRSNILDESPFRYWFITWFAARGYTADAESEKGSGRIDLKVQHPTIGKKIVEFKGWWNNDKSRITKQVQGYLTDFEGDGYVFMINNRKLDITDKYRQLIVEPETGYVANTWEKLNFPPTDFIYYRSGHRTGTKDRYLYHFIYSVY
jgi:hypothetical protein